MRSLGITGERELKRQLANPGSPGKCPLKRSAFVTTTMMLMMMAAGAADLDGRCRRRRCIVWSERRDERTANTDERTRPGCDRIRRCCCCRRSDTRRGTGKPSTRSRRRRRRRSSRLQSIQFFITVRLDFVDLITTYSGVRRRSC